MTSVRICHQSHRVEVLDPSGVVDPHCARFLERLAVRGLSFHTLEAYAYDLALLQRWMLETGLTLEELCPDDVHGFIAWERGRGSHAKSINRRLHTLCKYYRFVTGSDLPGGFERRRGFRYYHRDSELGVQRIPVPPVRQLRVREPRKLVDPLTIAQVRELLGGLRRYRDLCIAHLMLLCGLRTQECLSLRTRDIDFVDRRIRVTGKGNKERAVPLPKLVLDMFRRYMALERPSDCIQSHLFVVLQGKRRGQPMTRAGLRRVFRTRRRHAALEKANPHRLRHTFGADMARSGVRLPILQKMMGHAHIDTTMQYVNISLADVAAEFYRAIEKIEARYEGREE